MHYGKCMFSLLFEVLRWHISLIRRLRCRTVQVPNPKYALWVIKDQQVLNFLLASLSREILAHITTNLMASSAWATIDAMFASQS
jgi:hypothetical protein